MPAGAPRTIDRDAILDAFYKYIEETPVPIVAAFAYSVRLPRQYLYEMPELADAIKLCTTKKEAALEQGGLSGDLNTTMCVFSLKQLGWTDTQKHDVTVNVKQSFADIIASDE